MRRKYFKVILILLVIFGAFSVYKVSEGRYQKQDIIPPAGTKISEEQVENIMYKFKMVKVEKSFEGGIDNLVPDERERTRAFNSGAVRVYIGFNSKEEHIKLVIDPNNDVNPEDTAFIVHIDEDK